MAFILPPEKHGWLGPEEHFSDSHDVSKGVIHPHQLEDEAHQFREYHRHAPDMDENGSGKDGYLLDRRQSADRKSVPKMNLNTDPYFVGYVKDGKKASVNGFLSYPVEVPGKVDQDGSIVPNDKRKDALVYHTSSQLFFEKIETAPNVEANPKVNKVPPIVNGEKTRGKKINKSQGHDRSAFCFGRRRQNDDSFCYTAVSNRESRNLKPITIIDVDRFQNYENDAVSPLVTSPPNVLHNATAMQRDKGILDEPKILEWSGAERYAVGATCDTKSRYILKRPIEHLPHTRYIKLSNFQSTIVNPSITSPASGNKQSTKCTDWRQVYSNDSCRLDKSTDVHRAEVKTKNPFKEVSTEPRGKDWTGFETYRSAPENNPSWAEKSDKNKRGYWRSLSRERRSSPDSFAGKAKGPPIIVNEEVHATHDDTREEQRRKRQSDNSSGNINSVIIGRALSQDSGHNEGNLSRQSSQSVFSTGSRKRKHHKEENNYHDKDNFISPDPDELVKEHRDAEEHFQKKNDWTGLNTYQVHRDRFKENHQRLGLVSPDISQIREAHASFDKPPVVYTTISTGDVGCRNVVCSTKSELHENQYWEDAPKTNCFDDDRRHFQREGFGCQAIKPTNVKGREMRRQKPPEEIFDDIFETENRANASNQKVTLNNRADRKPNHQSSSTRYNGNMRVKTHYENPSFSGQASEHSLNRDSMVMFDEEQKKAQEDTPTIDELNQRFYTPATVLTTLDGKDTRFHNVATKMSPHPTKETQTMFTSRPHGTIDRSHNFYNIVGPSSKARAAIPNRSAQPYYDQLRHNVRRPAHQMQRGFDEVQPSEHIYSSSFRIVPDFEDGRNYRDINTGGKKHNVQNCEANGAQFGANRDGYESPDDYGNPFYYVHPGDFETSDDYDSHDDNESPNGDENNGSPNRYRHPNEYYENRDGGNPLGQNDKTQVVAGTWDFLNNMFQKKKFRDAAYNKRAEVSCGDCGNGMRFTLSVGMQDTSGCLVCYNRVRDDFTELLNAYKEKGYMPCECKQTLSVTDLVNGFLEQEKLECTCVKDAFQDV